MSESWLQEQAALSLERLLPRIIPLIDGDPEPALFFERLNTCFPTLFELLFSLYGEHYDFFYHLEAAIAAAATSYRARSTELRVLDQRREAEPGWFQSETMMGGVGYADRFAGTLAGVRERIPYFQELGLRYLHLMPLFESPAVNNDGGYAISSFREVNPALGTMQELAQLAADLRAQGISLVLDFVFNHTSDEHVWAQRALTGDRAYQAYYRMFDDRTVPDQYEPHLREIFPEHAPGNFTYQPAIGKWVWTTFYPFQWDLNYANPALFNAMLQEMLFLANQGVEVLRLDAVPFIWKQAGTNCENLPQAHLIIRAYNALMRIANPALIFKSEAIVHPRDVRSYIDPAECALSYNPILMVALWEALATRQTRLLTEAMRQQFELDPRCSWINYIRSHDDIGWGFADEDAGAVGIDGHPHRYFLNQFYTGEFPGSFARGLPFNYNPKNGDMRITGTTASLAGLEAALQSGETAQVERAIRRILMIYGITFSIGGIPLLYLGDEVATLNDYGYLREPAHAHDSRWVHRPRFNAARTALRHDANTVEGRIFGGLKQMIELRAQHTVFRNGETQFLELHNQHLFGFTRHDQLCVVANFADHEQQLSLTDIGLGGQWRDLLGEQREYGTDAAAEANLRLAPYQLVWLLRA